MKGVINQAVLWVYCFAAAVFVSADELFVAAALAALLYACGNILMRQEWGKRGLTVIYMILSFICPQFLLFTPVVLYGILGDRDYVAAAALEVLCVWRYGPVSPAVVCLTVVGSMVAGLLQSQTDRYLKLEEKFCKTRDDGAEKNLLLKEKNQSILEKQDYEIYTATLRERNRIAREIHDNVGHMLSRAILMVGAMKAVHGDGRLSASMEQLEETLNAAMTSVRKSVHDIHDESVNLKEILESLVKEFSFCSARLEYDMGYDVPREIRYSFIAIVKEALHNISEHSNATRAEVIAREHPAFYQLIIEDNGTAGSKSLKYTQDGLPGSDGSSGIGLKNMKDRVDSFGGNIDIRRGRGWRIYITVPKKTHKETTGAPKM
ncbi:MAG: sensor histidine kinase [Dorea sp.]|jgi:signal transduction histidine kinase|nr:sensor histidine kinase [Dorea sp.]